MKFSQERWVKLYKRDEPEFMALSWQARGLFCLLMRKVDAAGFLACGRLGKKGVAVSVGAPWAEVGQALDELLEDGCVRFYPETGQIHLPNFLEAQSATQDASVRKQASRDLAIATVAHGLTPMGDALTLAKLASGDSAVTVDVTNRDIAESRIVTPCHGQSRTVTDGHGMSLLEENRSEQIRTERESRERARTRESIPADRDSAKDVANDSSAATGPRIDEATPLAIPGHPGSDRHLPGHPGQDPVLANSDPLTRPMDPWARPAFESLRMVKGDYDVDPQLEWVAWMGHIVSERANSGRVIAVERGGWTKWLTNAFRKAPIAKRPQVEAPVKKFKPLEARPTDEEIAKNLAAAQAMIDRLDEEDRPQNEEDPEVA